MKIGILYTSIGGFAQKGYYNVQEIGLAKELDRFFEEVIVYKAIYFNEAYSVEKIKGSKNSLLHLIPTRKIGNNGLIDLNKLDTRLDCLIYSSSDLQLALPKVEKWCIKNNIQLLPYIGVVESHSENRLKKLIMEITFYRNIKVYKNVLCLVKNPQVKKKLLKYGINDCEVIPVGLDLDLLNSDYKEANVVELKEKWGYTPNDRVLLFIGRLVPEKEPLQLIEIYEKLTRKDDSFKLLIVGDGFLKLEVKKLITEKELNEKITIVEKIPNFKIWELYRMAEAFINLNRREIFGMAILEAMYYECKVVAWEAPGPNYIITTNRDGIICNTENEIINAIFKKDEKLKLNSHKTILERFTWKELVKHILFQCYNTDFNSLKGAKRNGQ